MISLYRTLPWAGLCVAACLCIQLNTRAVEVVAGPGEEGLRATIASAQDGDTVIVNSLVELKAPLRVTKGLTFRGVGLNARIYGGFNGVLIEVANDRAVFEQLVFAGSSGTDGFKVEMDLLMRDCQIYGFRAPMQTDFWLFPDVKVRLDRVRVDGNQHGLSVYDLEARDCSFSFNMGLGCVAWFGEFVGCRFEHNQGDGLSVLYATVKNCLFRYNGDFGLRFDPDPGMLNLSGSVFYANAGGGLLLRESAYAVVDNCTFTRHTGRPAVVITEASDVLFRHCTVADNLVIDPGSSPWYPSGNAFAIGFSGRIELQNCLVANNPTSETPNAAGMDPGWVDGGGNVIGGDPKLGVLRDNGGPLPSMLPLPGSPAIDAGRSTDLITDARGFARQAGYAPDAGAAEAYAEEIADVDADGLPDFWETLHGLSDNDPADAASDRDGDGSTALSEFWSQTNPTNALSAQRFKEMTLLPEHPSQPFVRYIILSWDAAPGIAYELESSADLQRWTRASAWLGINVREDGIRSMTAQVTADSPATFYRLVVKRSAFD